MTLSEKIPPSQKFDITGKLLETAKIHNLTNFGNVDVKLTCSKCYFNSVMQMLHASPKFRHIINELSKLPQLDTLYLSNYEEGNMQCGCWTVSKLIKQFFDGIETGTMDKYEGKSGNYNQKADQNYTEALKELIKGLEANMAKREQIRNNFTYSKIIAFLQNPQQNDLTKLTEIMNSAKKIAKQRNPLIINQLTGGAAGAMVHEILQAVDLELAVRGQEPLTKIQEITICTFSLNG